MGDSDLWGTIARDIAGTRSGRTLPALSCPPSKRGDRVGCHKSAKGNEKAFEAEERYDFAAAGALMQMKLPAHLPGVSNITARRLRISYFICNSRSSLFR